MRALLLAFVVATASPAAVLNVPEAAHDESGASITAMPVSPAPASPAGPSLELPPAQIVSIVRFSPAIVDAPRPLPPSLTRDSRATVRRAHAGTHVPRMGTDEPPAR